MNQKCTRIPNCPLLSQYRGCKSDLLSAANASPIVIFTSYQEVGEKSICKNEYPSPLLFYVLKNVVGLFIPLFIVGIFQILTWKTLRQSKAKKIMTRSKKRHRNLRRASLTCFLIVVAFFLLTLPNRIFEIWVMYQSIFNRQWFKMHAATLFDLWDGTNVLLVFNACINPLIYAKVHRRLTNNCVTNWKRRKTNHEKTQMIHERTQILHTRKRKDNIARECHFSLANNNRTMTVDKIWSV